LVFSTKTERRILWNIKEWKKERGKATGKGRKKRKKIREMEIVSRDRKTAGGYP